MLKWFRPNCTVDSLTRAWIDCRWRWLGNEFGSDASTVLPTPDFFPDKYDESEPSVRTLVDRVCRYMGVEPARVDLKFYSNPQRPYLINERGHGIGDARGTYHKDDSRFVISLEREQLHEPMHLVGTIAHELAHVRLLGEGRIDREAFDNELLTDLTAVFFGMGIFRANSPGYALARLSFWPESDQPKPEYMTTAMYGYALANRCWLRDEPLPRWRKHLKVGVRAEFKQAFRFLESL